MGGIRRETRPLTKRSGMVRSFPVRLQRAVCFRIMLRQGTLPPSAVAHKTSRALLLKLQTKLRLGCQPTHQCDDNSNWFGLFRVQKITCFVASSELVTMIHHRAKASNIGYFAWNPGATYQHASCNVYLKFS